MFSNIEIPMFYCYEHYMFILHIALIVNMVHELHHGNAFLIDNIQLNPVCSTEDKTSKKSINK